LRTSRNLLFFLLPATILVGIFVYCFAAWTGYLSLTDWRGIGHFGEFIGFSNYESLFQNSVAMNALVNTLVLAVAFIVVTTAWGLGVAILLEMGFKGAGLMKAICLLPLSFSFVVSATMWTWMFAPVQGTLNTLLRMLQLGFLCQPWITSPSESLFCVLIVYVWQFSGFVTLIYFAGIRAVPQEFLEAAEIDGASTFQKYRNIVVPLQKGETVGVVTILLFYALRVFDLVYLMTGGGPALSSEVLATYMYRVTFNQNLFAYGASVGFLLFILAMAIMIPFLYLTGRGR